MLILTPMRVTIGIGGQMFGHIDDATYARWRYTSASPQAWATDLPYQQIQSMMKSRPYMHFTSNIVDR